MAAEIRAAYVTGLTIYANLRNSSGQIWNGTTFETYASANYSNYKLPMTEQGASAEYFATFPSAINSGGSYEFIVYQQAGGAPAEGVDAVVGTGTVNWNGISVVSTSTNGMSGSDFRDYVVGDFIRTDKDAQIYRATTDVVQQLRRRFSFEDDEYETTLTDVLSSVGDYKLDLETNTGLLISNVVVLDSYINSWPLHQLSKQQFDTKYPNPTATNVLKYQPIDFCIFNKKIYLGPVPDKTTYTFKISYSIDPNQTISSITTFVPFTAKYREMVKAGVLYRLYLSLEQIDRSGYWKQQYEELYKEAVGREENNRGSVSVVRYRDI